MSAKWKEKAKEAGPRLKVRVGDFGPEGSRYDLASFSLSKSAHISECRAAECGRKAQREECEKMNAKASWTCLYFLLYFMAKERCDACSWMMSQYREKSAYCLSLLTEMGGEIITRKQSFPYAAYGEVDAAKADDQMRFLAEVTEQIVTLFNTVAHVSDVKWDSRALENFLNVLDSRQLKELKKCTATYAERAGHSHSERQLRRHFKKLKKILKKANYSTDSLERIRYATMHHLMRMDIIAASVRQKLLTRTH